ncbi:MAG TPA: insulinase family protein [Vicinamibacterales bacterium]|nr:insulinase family protein [Vicinamibacterales bacterium]
MKRTFVSLLIIGACVGLTTDALLDASQAAPAAQPLALDQVLPIDTAVRTGQLSNGLRYFIRRNTRPANRVSLRLAVNVGSIHEDDDQRGLAHFLEHMAFNGTENFKPGELITFLESIGARFGPHVNAYTSFDETVYMLDVPTDKPGYVDRGLLALYDFGAGMSLSQAEIDKERGVVIEEWRGRLGAGSRLTDKQLPILLSKSRYAERLPIGTPEILKSFPRQRILDFYRRWYRPDQMAVVVVGDIDPAEAQKMVEQRFGRIAAVTTPIETVERAVPGHKETLFAIATDPEAQGWSVALAHKRPVEVDQTVGEYRRSLIQQLATQMLNLRLREIARKPNAPFLGAEAEGSALGRSVEMYELGASVPEGGISAGLEALIVEARRMQQFGFAQDELDRARAGVLASYERALKERDTNESRGYADEYVRAFLEREPIPGIEFEHRIASTLLPAVTVAEVTAEARKLISDENRVVVVVAPEKKELPVPTEAALRSAMARAEKAPIEAYTDALAGRELVEKPPVPGKVTARRTVPEVDATVMTLSNGVEVWLKPTDFKNDQVIISAYAKGGASLASEADFQEASLATSLVGIGGLGGLSPVDLSKLLAGKIAQASPSIGTYTHGINGAASPRDLETAFKLNYLAFTAPNLTRESFELMKRRIASVLENQAQNPGFVFNERVDQINTSNHYSAKALTVADIGALDLEVMQRFYRERFSNAADFTYFIVGAFTVDEITPLLEKWIATLPSTGKRTSAFREIGVRFPTATSRDEVRKGREPRGQTVMSFFADTKLDELEMHRARAAASLLGTRLRDILREELGGTYGVSVGYENSLPAPGYGSMTVTFGSDPGNIEKLTAEVVKEVERLKAQGPSAEDVGRVQELERRDLETAVKQNAYWIGSLQTVHMLGWDPNGITRREARIQSLTPQVLHETFKKYFPADRYTVVTLKPEQP